MYYIKLTIAVYYKSNEKYKRYFLFNLPDINAEEIIILIYINNRHYNLINPKRKDRKNKKIYTPPNKTDERFIFSSINKNIKILKKRSLFKCK